MGVWWWAQRSLCPDSTWPRFDTTAATCTWRQCPTRHATWPTAAQHYNASRSSTKGTRPFGTSLAGHASDGGGVVEARMHLRYRPRPRGFLGIASQSEDLAPGISSRLRLQDTTWT